jgi:hypothetical protein
MSAVKKVLKVTQAQYIKEAESIVLLGEGSEGTFRQQIHRLSFSYQGLSGDDLQTRLSDDKGFEEEYIKELEKTASLMIGKSVNMVFDPELNEKIKKQTPLKYE